MRPQSFDPSTSFNKVELFKSINPVNIFEPRRRPQSFPTENPQPISLFQPQPQPQQIPQALPITHPDQFNAPNQEIEKELMEFRAQADKE